MSGSCKLCIAPDRRRRPMRRGVLLLVVMALLSLLTLLGLTLVLTTSQARMSAIAAARANSAGVRDHSEMEEVFNQIVRGSRDPDSVLQAHSLLEDLYGAPQAFGVISSIPQPMAGGQLLQMTVTNEANAPVLTYATGAYTGCVITMLSGNAAGRSSRVTDYRYVGGQSLLQAASFDGVLPIAGDRFVINGRPFSGTGFGLNVANFGSPTTPWPATSPWPLVAGTSTTTPLLNAIDITEATGANLLALLPNHAQIDWQANSGYLDSVSAKLVGPGPAGPGGANEPYDAVDFQNMILGLVYYDPISTKTVVIPSLHRPELVTYWATNAAGSISNSTTRRKIILRPEPNDQVYQETSGTPSPNAWDPQEFLDANLNGIYDAGELAFDLNGNGVIDIGDRDFTGKPFCPMYGPWDIDNDGDGTPDSIWVDVGLQVQTAPDGTKYKTLAAILCIDLDGRVNLNAHGTLAHLDPNRYSPVENSTYVLAPFAGTAGTSQGLASAGQVQPETSNGAGGLHRYFPIGQGMGPAEVNLLPTLMAGGAAIDTALRDYAYLQLGQLNTTTTPPTYLEGRYGEILRPGVNTYAPPPGIVNYNSSFNPFWAYAASRPGWSYWYDPSTNIVSDPIPMARESNVRPFLLQPALQVTPAYFFSYLTGPTQFTPLGYSTPYDLHARGVLALDLRGQPYYTGTSNLPWTTQLTDPTISQLINDAIDTSYELDLSQNAQHDGKQTTSNQVASIDQPFTPAELEGLLRCHDQDKASNDARQRLLTLAPSLLNSDVARRQATTESWDLTVPNVSALTLQQALDLKAFSSKTTLPLRYNNLSVVDLARARIFNQISSQTPTPPPSAALLGNPYALDDALFGNLINNQGAFPAVPVWPLLAPEVVLGQKLDINRVFGNGVDDNNNGAVDDWHEAAAGEYLTYPTSVGGVATGVQLDHNNDGFLIGNDPTFADTRARQLLARHLYTMMMLLIDDSLAKANIFQSNGAVMPVPWPKTTALTGTPPLYRQQAAYVVAQWAINAVDFRDSDSVMTAFEFDLTPFQDDDGNVANGTWDIDDIVSTQEDAAATIPYRGVVWGCERPELVITETIAVHDRGTDDTNNAANLASGMPDTYTNDTTATQKDTDYDQVRRPRGSLVVELLNITNPWDAPHHDLQYDANLGVQQPWLQADNNGNQGYGVNLAQVATGVPLGVGPAASPVWRLVISYSPNYDESTFYTGAPGTNAKSAPVDPRVPVLPASYIHRAVYFAPYNANFVAVAKPNYVNEISTAQSFFLDSGLFTTSGPRALMLPPSQYAVVGPAASNGGLDMIYLGQNTKAATAGNNNPYQIQLGNQANGSTLTNVVTGGIPDPMYAGIPATIKPVIGVPIETTWLAGGFYTPHSGAPTNTLRMSVSEPDTGYPVWNGTVNDDGFYYTAPGTPTAGQKFPQTPFDSSDPNNTYVTNPNPYVAPTGATNNDPVTTTNYTVIYLQRLADPLAPWDAALNPYLTVDRMPVDLTAYTGENQPTNSALANTYEPSTTGYKNANSSPLSSFSTRRRGYNTSGNATVYSAENAPNFFAPIPVSPAPTANFGIVTGASTTSPMAGSTLGYLNSEYGTFWTAGSASANIGSSGVNSALYNGDPAVPSPWLTWNDRPYVSQYELMLVPASSPSSLYADFGMVNWNAELGSTAPSTEFQTGYTYFNSNDKNTPALPWAQFRHLLNFYDSQQGAGSAGTNGNGLSNMHRIFDFVTVPSRFAGTQTMLSPTQFFGTTAGPASGVAPHYFHPPFHWLSRYREPGRINLNTVMDTAVFEGLMDDYPGWSTLWQNVIASRRGYLGAGILSPNPAMPTFFANPFRPEGASAAVPLSSMSHFPGFGVNATLQRTKAPNSNPNSTAFATSALFDDSSFDPFNSTPSYQYGSGSTTPYRDAGRSAYFQYQALQRLGNMTTNRSNVYAIWITLGQFEVTQVGITATNPDGYKLLQEVGTATGDIKRQRSFFLYDRSIPVGFIRGQDLNAERGVLIERTLEE